jgi:hypothetical protein
VFEVLGTPGIHGVIRALYQRAQRNPGRGGTFQRWFVEFKIDAERLGARRKT